MDDFEKQQEVYDKVVQVHLDQIKKQRNDRLNTILMIDREVSVFLDDCSRKRKLRLRNLEKKEADKKVCTEETQSGIHSSVKGIGTADKDLTQEQNLCCAETQNGNEKSDDQRKIILDLIIREVPSIKSYFLKEKKYFHFDKPVKMNTVEDIENIRDWLNDPDKIAKHSFLPLISKTQVSRQKRKIEEFRFYEKTLKITKNPDIKKLCLENIEKFHKNGPIKTRPIRICSNRDSLIFAHYNRLLADLYEKYIQNLGFSDSVIAYRKKPSVIINGTKCSFQTIPAVYDVVQYIKEHDNKCVALAFDMSSFFDCIDHRNLKEEWKKVLGVNELPPDHYNIFKALTRYCYVEDSEIEEYADCIKNENDTDEESTDVGKSSIGTASETDKGSDDEKIPEKKKRESLKKYFTNISDFRKFRKWYSHNSEYAAFSNFHKNPGLQNNEESCGIPQGLSIGTTLSNIYMLPFDKAVSEYARERGFLYRRYCDDIMIVGDMAREDIQKVYDFISSEIRKRGKRLKLHPFIQDFYNPYSKSQCYDFSSPNIKKLPMQYLGFYYDGVNVRIREGSISSFYRNMDKSVTAMYLQTFRRIKRRLLREHDIHYLLDNKLGKVRMKCVRYYDDDSIVYTGARLSSKYSHEAKRRIKNRCNDKYHSISQCCWFESDLKNIVSRFVLIDTDKKTGKVKYRRAFLPNVKRLHKLYSFRSNKNFMSYAMNAARIFSGQDNSNSIIRKQMRSHSRHLHRKINDAYMKTCFQFKRMIYDAVTKKYQ